MGDKPLHVFKEESERLFLFQDALDFKEERPARILEAEPLSSGRERLAGKSGKQEIEIGNVGTWDFRDVAVDVFLLEKLLVRLNRVGLDFACEDAIEGIPQPLTRLLKPEAYPSQPRKQINDANRLLRLLGDIEVNHETVNDETAFFGKRLSLRNLQNGIALLIR